VIVRYQELLERFPDNELARFSLGKAYFDAGQFLPAREQFEIALKIEARLDGGSNSARQMRTVAG